MRTFAVLMIAALTLLQPIAARGDIMQTDSVATTFVETPLTL